MNVELLFRPAYVWQGQTLTKTDAHAILDQVKAGLSVPDDLVLIALQLTGDL